jgi:hypothetical protein
MFSTNAIRLAELRQAMEQRFPETVSSPPRYWMMGWDLLDAHGGLVRGVITELTGGIGCSALFVDRILAAAEKGGHFAALIDCGSLFDPGSYQEAVLQRLLCTLCKTPELALKAADLLLRDGNLPLVLLDLQTIPLRSLTRIPASTWHRFQRLTEKSETAFVVLTPQPLIEAARIRIALRNGWNLGALHRRRIDLLEEIELQVFNRNRCVPSRDEPLVRTA